MTALDMLDRRIVNHLQGGLPLVARPYAAAADDLGIDEATLIARLRHLLKVGMLSRFGPMFDAERLGGALTLAALAVPEDRFDAVAEQVNAHPEVAHNYRREHALNMWFVVATEHADGVGEVLAAIAAETELEVHDMPKLDEYFLELRLQA